MSKKITHKEVEKAIDKHTWLTGKLADWAGYDWSDLEEGYDFITNENIIINYITQQEELEETIKELQNILETNYDNLIDLGHYIISVRNSNKKLTRRIVKQQKLLELYKEYYELDRMYVKNNFFLELENLNRRSEIVEQIKELENE